MATVHYLYRSTREKGLLEVRLQHLNLIWTAKSKIEVTKTFWNTQRKIKTRDIAIKNEQIRVSKECSELENFIIGSLKGTVPEALPKDWLKGILNPTDKTVNKVIPTTLVDYIDYYIEYERHAKRTESTKKRFNVIKNKLQRMEEWRKRPILIKEIGIDFLNEFIDYCLLQNYSQNTIQRDFVFIKTFCIHARGLGLETHLHLNNKQFKVSKAPVDKIYLTLEEIDIIQKIEGLSESLKNVRDWLVISCFTAQRVSDFMRFNSSMIRTENGVRKLQFKQQKTEKNMTVPILPKVTEILAKNNGEFPTPISDQKYNDYLKELCEIAGFTQKVKGSKMIEVNGNFRKVEDYYRKCDLVSSHIGRRSFATNFYGEIPTPILMSVTGHTTENMFLEYIGKSKDDRSLELIKYF
jgi:integrase